MTALGIKKEYLPSELLVKPSQKRLAALYRKLGQREDSSIQRLEKIYQQKDDALGDDEEEDENGENIFGGEEQEEESDGDADYTYQNCDDDEDYLDDEDVGDGDGKFFKVVTMFTF